MTRRSESPLTEDPLAVRSLLDALPCGVVAVGPRGELLGANRAAHDLLPGLESDARRCGDLMPCSGPDGPCGAGCLAARAAQSDEALPEFRVDVARGDGPASAVWVTGAPLRHRPGAVLHLRPGDARDRRRRTDPHWLAGPRLRLRVLGTTRVESEHGDLGGEWLHQRAGQLLKLLVCERRRVVPVDEIAETIWPGSGRTALGNTRYFVHRLRSRLEPAREGHGHSSFVIGTAGGYAIDRDRVWIDADEFERLVEEGTKALARLDTENARRLLEQALELYGGDLLADDPYADWAYAERDRLRELATRSLQALVVVAREHGDSRAVSRHLLALAELEPFDSAVHRELLADLVAQGRHSAARRRYATFVARVRREFGQEPDFTLKCLGPSSA